MSKKNKVIYSNIQPNPKEAGIWINTNDGNIKVEKDGKWVDDSIAETPSTPSEPVKVSMIPFSINGVPCLAEEGMTWAEWIDSEYNNSSYKYTIDEESGFIVYEGDTSKIIGDYYGTTIYSSLELESKELYKHRAKPSNNEPDFN